MEVGFNTFYQGDAAAPSITSGTSHVLRKLAFAVDNCQICRREVVRECGSVDLEGFSYCCVVVYGNVVITISLSVYQLSSRSISVLKQRSATS